MKFVKIFLGVVFFIIYDLIWFVLSFFIKRNILDEIKIAPKAEEVFIFFCSSAGEFEQARPVILNVLKQGFDAHVIFLSSSGYKYFKSKNEIFSFSMMRSDDPFYWFKFFRLFEGKKLYSIIVRHEFWPGFMNIAHQFSKLVLINASPKSSYLKDSRNFDLVLSTDQLQDTKYEAAFLRSCEPIKPENQKTLEEIKTAKKHYKILIAGSAWPADVDFLINAYSNLKNTMIFIFPHDVCEKMKQRLEKKLPPEAPFKIINSLGVLSDAYRLADYAWIGGGLHHRVHNVLEAAIFGIPCGMGPRIEHSQEAIKLFAEKHAVATDNPQVFCEYLKKTKKYKLNIENSSLQIIKQIRSLK